MPTALFPVFVSAGNAAGRSIAVRHRRSYLGMISGIYAEREAFCSRRERHARGFDSIQRLPQQLSCVLGRI
jgi:hypothetical protein